MHANTPAGQALVNALEASDAASRPERADRIVWASRHGPPEGVIVGRLEPLRLVEEARACYVGGQFIAALLTATAFIEHTIEDELNERGFPGDRRTFAAAIAMARAASLFPADLLDRADALRQLRNPFAHSRGDDDAHSLGTRFRERRTHPTSILEADAQEAIRLMYAFFAAALRRGCC